MRVFEVGTDSVLLKFNEDDSADFILYKPVAATASLPAATDGVGLIWDAEAGALKVSTGSAWETITSS